MSDLHEHDEHCGCGCEHDHDVQYMTLQTEDNQELKCAVIGIFEVEEIEDKEYIALLPDGSDEVLLYEYIEAEDGEGFELANIESDEEFSTVEDAFMQMLDYDDDDDYEYEELDEEE